MRQALLVVLVAIVGCRAEVTTNAVSSRENLADARKGFQTQVIKQGEDWGAPDVPPGKTFELIKYPSEVGQLSAYITKDPGDGQKHPAIVWITGGDNNTIGDVWSPSPPDNDQSASAFRKAGIVMMFPSQRGGNDNPGKREGFLGEVDDVLAATDYLAKLDYVDPNQIYLGGHSTGGTMAMLIGATSDRYRGILSLGPVATPTQYGGDFVYCDVSNAQEMRLRSPIEWLHSVKSPMLVLEGLDGGNWHGSIDVMADGNSNPQIQFFPVPGHDHFTVIDPVAKLMAEKIVNGSFTLTEAEIQSLR